MSPIQDPRAIWPDARSLYHSRLYHWFLRQGGPKTVQDRTSATMITLLMRYACRECLFLAAAIGRACGEPHRFVQFTMAEADETHLVHAVLCLEPGPLDAGSLGLDILGVTPIGRITEDLTPLGEIIRSEIEPADHIRPEDFAPGQEAVALQVAGCLPWLAGHVPARYRVREADALARLAELTADPAFAARSP